MRSPTADPEERDRGHLAERVVRDAVPDHRWPHCPVCRQRGPQRFFAAFQAGQRAGTRAIFIIGGLVTVLFGLVVLARPGIGALTLALLGR
jgi:hypothetical protein